MSCIKEDYLRRTVGSRKNFEVQRQHLEDVNSPLQA
jgi:hypothetical protein